MSAPAHASPAPLPVRIALLRAKVAASAAQLLLSCESVLRQLAPALPETSGAYVSQVQRVLATEPLTLVIASTDDAQSRVVGVTIVRLYENSYNGTKLHLEGMLTDAGCRSRGVGRAMMNAVKAFGIQSGATDIALQVSSQNPGAHRFFAHERFDITDLAFTAPSTKPVRGGSHASPASPLAAAAGASAVTQPLSPVVPVSASSSAVGFSVMDICDSATRTVPASNLALLAAAEPVLRQVGRPRLPNTTEGFVARMQTIAVGGARILLAVRTPSSSTDAPVVLGVCVHRFYKDLARGGALRNFIDDLVTDSNQRSQGVGAALIELARQEARSLGVQSLELDSGVHRFQAHKFYFREGFIVDALSFGFSLAPAPVTAAPAAASTLP